MPAARKPTEIAFHQLGQVLRDLESDLRWKLEGSVRIPEAWHQIAQERVQPGKAKLTLRLDEDVIRFFRAMGRGHLVKMNAVLRAFMLARLAEVVKAEPRYEPDAAEVERRIKAEVMALVAAQAQAREDAVARMAEEAGQGARREALQGYWRRKMEGG